VMVQIKNTSTSKVTCAFYVGIDELIPAPVVSGGGGGGGGGAATEVSADFVRDLDVYASQQVFGTSASAFTLKSLLPAGAKISDWVIIVDDASTGSLMLGATSSGSGLMLKKGKGLAGSNDYPLYLRAIGGEVTANIMITYRV